MPPAHGRRVFTSHCPRLSYLYLSEERSARFLLAPGEVQRPHTRKANSCTKAIVVAWFLLSSRAERKQPRVNSGSPKGDICVADAGRRSVRRGSSLQQLTLRTTSAVARFFLVILSAAKDLDGRSDDRASVTHLSCCRKSSGVNCSSLLPRSRHATRTRMVNRQNTPHSLTSPKANAPDTREK